MQDKLLTIDPKLEEELTRCSERVIGAAIEVHKCLGPGFLEDVYGQALAIELADRGIEFVAQLPVGVQYKGHTVGEGKIDLLVEQKLVVELKAVEALAPIHSAQVISYLKSTGLHLGLLINFNVRLLKDGIKRIAL